MIIAYFLFNGNVLYYINYLRLQKEVLSLTLKEYLEKQISHWSKAKQEACVDTAAYCKADGRVMAYVDILLACPDKMLNKKILEEVW